jgi:glycosyltransferase involved in cell wall biosynthesis
LIEDGKTGTLFAPDDPAMIAKALDGLFADRAHWPERRAAARAFVAEERNWQKNIVRYDPVYQLLLGRAMSG